MPAWERWNGTEWVRQGGVAAGSMSADELYHWQVKAALLDPLAYDFLMGASASATVPAGETWQIVDAWNALSGAGTKFHHRKPDVLNGNCIPVKAGETITLSSVATSHVLICKPDAVIAADPRYAENPRGLFYERLRRLDQELTHYDIGHTNTAAAGRVTTAFPTDFTYGMVLHVSAHDIAWVGLKHSSATLTLNLNNELSDSTPQIRFSERMTVPFVRADFPNIYSASSTLPEGVCNVRYVKLPADW